MAPGPGFVLMENLAGTRAQWGPEEKGEGKGARRGARSPRPRERSTRVRSARHCEVPGLYYFAVHATVYRASLQFDIMKNGHSIASFFQYYGNWPKPTSLSGGALVRLEPEDEVWVQVGVGDYIGFYASVKTDSTFTGFLVYSYWHNSAVFA